MIFQYVIKLDSSAALEINREITIFVVLRTTKASRPFILLCRINGWAA